ncbi:hypothetical protein HMPREF0185_00321 [Brevundimonas diminuta 470-4]|nr:hypothetical protein HMPREF0185_00321 [Brevundimonas diminuta 470-4]
MLGLKGPALTAALLFQALPTTSSAYIMARQLGGDAPLMASITVIQTHKGKLRSFQKGPAWISCVATCKPNVLATFVRFMFTIRTRLSEGPLKSYFRIFYDISHSQ